MATDAQSTSASPLVDLLLKVAAAFATVAGFVGLVTLVGGAVMWTRFYTNHLPADQAVSVLPREELVTIGATALIFFVLAGLLSVLLVYLLDPRGSPSAPTKAGLLTLAVAGVLAAIVVSDLSRAKAAAAAGVAVLGGLTVAAVVWWVGPRVAPRWRWLGRRWRDVCILLQLVVAAATALLLALFQRSLGGIVVLVVVLAIVALVIASVTGDRFRWYGLAVFLSVALLGAVLGVVRSYNRIQPVAVLLSGSGGDGGFYGVYIAESDDRVYVGRVEPRCGDVRRFEAGRIVGIEGGSGRVLSIPRDRVVALSVGPLQKLTRALERGPEMLAELREVAGRPEAVEGDEAESVAAAGSATSSPEPSLDEQFCASRPPPGAITGGTAVSPDVAFPLAERFRPILRFDSLERWRPLNIESFLDEHYAGRVPRAHRLCAGDLELQASCRSAPSATEFGPVLARGIDEHTYLDISGDLSGPGGKRSTRMDAPEYCSPARPFCAPSELLRDCDDCDASAIYYNVTRAGGRYYVDYWWFFRFNHAGPFRTDRACTGRKIPLLPQNLNPFDRLCFDHEGDWEGVTVVTSADDPPTLEFVGFAAHEGTFRFARSALQVRGERPVVYVARGTHASYPEPCASNDRRFALTQCKQAARLIRRLPRVQRPDGRFDGGAPWGRNGPAQCRGDHPCLLPLPVGAAGSLSWNDWRGRWGSCEVRGRRCTLVHGPPSPSAQSRFTEPWCFILGGQRECDVAAPGN